MSKFKTPARAARRPGHVRVALRDLGLAPENLRFDEPADEGVAQLADTILAAGVVIPPIVRPGGEGEQAFMALDGRRRRMALLLLRDRGDIDDGYEVDCVMARDQAARAAAVVLANSERAPVHVADIILAIGKLRASGMDTRSIAAALGYGEIEVRRLQALAAVRPKVICALRLGKITLRQAKLFARLPDPAQQDDLAQAALDGHLHEYQLRSLVDGEASTREDARLTLVGAERYGQAGGRIESDLFGELPDRLLDAVLLERLWRERVEALRGPLQAQGLAVYISDGQGFRAPDGFEAAPYVYTEDLPAQARAERAAASAEVERLEALLALEDLTEEAALARLADLVLARRADKAAVLAPRVVGAVVISPSTRFGVATTFYVEPWPEETSSSEDLTSSADSDEAAGEIEVPGVEVEVAGASHRLHERRTDMATRALIRDLADRPQAALSVLLAELFKQLALRGSCGVGTSALALRANAYRPDGTEPVPQLDGEVVRRLEARREAYLASGLRPLAFVEALEPDDRMALLAEFVAISLDLREPRTSAIRRAARVEAAEIATLCEADISAHWTPDAGYLGVHSKRQLLEMHAEMGLSDPRTSTMKKDELIALTAQACADRSWAPGCLSWRGGEPAPSDEAPEDGEGAQVLAAQAAA